jgi:hypothetical protein
MGLEKRAGELDKHHSYLTVGMITRGFLINQQGLGNLHSSFATVSNLTARTVRAGAAELETLKLLSSAVSKQRSMLFTYPVVNHFQLLVLGLAGCNQQNVIEYP